MPVGRVILRDTGGAVIASGVRVTASHETQGSAVGIDGQPLDSATDFRRTFRLPINEALEVRGSVEFAGTQYRVTNIALNARTMVVNGVRRVEYG